MAARWGRWGLTQALDELVTQRFLSEAEAYQAAQDIFCDNAGRLYRVAL